jgi:hypothetical protein
MRNASDWELLDDGSFNGVKKYIRSSDDDEGTVQVRYEGFDVPIILDRNKKAQAEHNATAGLGEMVHAAHIPASVLLEWFAADKVWAPDDMEYMTRKLNDPDWRYLKRLPITL